MEVVNMPRRISAFHISTRGSLPAFYELKEAKSTKPVIRRFISGKGDKSLPKYLTAG